MNISSDYYDYYKQYYALNQITNAELITQDSDASQNEVEAISPSRRKSSSQDLDISAMNLSFNARMMQNSLQMQDADSLGMPPEIGGVGPGPAGTKPEDILDSLVTSGTITEDQKDAIQSAFEQAFQSAQAQSGTTREKPEDVLDSLVTNGTITKDQETAIQSAFESDRKAHELYRPFLDAYENQSDIFTTEEL